MRAPPTPVSRSLGGALVLVSSLAWLVAPGGAALAATPADPAAARDATPEGRAPGITYPATSPGDDILRRVLRSGCHEGLPDVQWLAANGSVPWAEPVARMCAEVLRAEPPPRLTLAPPGPTRAGRPERDGRGAMVISSTLYGIWVGIATDVLFTIDGARSAVVPPLLGMGAALGLSLQITGDHPLDNGQAWTVITGLEFGSIDGALWAGGLDSSAKTVVGATLATGLASGVAGLIAANELDPPQGDVEVIRSGLVWGTLTGLLGMAAISTGSSSQTYLRGTAVSMDLGLLAGLGLAASFDISRNRDLLIDAGGLGGGVAGLGLSWLFTVAPNVSARPIFAGTLAGMYVGLATAAYLTRNMAPDDDERDPSVAAIWGRDDRGRWGWGTPGATPVLDGLGHRVIGAAFTALGGVF